MAYRDKKSSKIKGVILVWLIRLTYWLPRWVSYQLNRGITRLNLLCNGKTTGVMQRNLELCYPQLNATQIKQEIKRHIEQNAYLTHEFATAWLAERAAIERQIVSATGDELIAQSLKVKRPVILAVPHLGNWEFFWHWLQFNYPLCGMYQPAKFSGVNQLVLQARSRFGGELFATDQKGILGLMRALKQGKVMMILPDQAPREGAGIYSPFFGHPAYTMTLLHKFIAKTGAQLLFGACLRDASNSQFTIHVEAPKFDFENLNLDEFNRAMNGQIEMLINQWPDQYQWSYKRFKRQAEGKNPYR